MAERAAKVTLGTAQKALQSVIAPDLNEIKGALKVLDTKIDGTNSRIGELDKRLGTKVDELDKRLGTKVDEPDKRLTSKVDELDKRVSSKIDELDKRLTGEVRALSEKVDIVRDVERLKVEVAELKKRP